jgi:caa(3)-type oxidase subunit IV
MSDHTATHDASHAGEGHGGGHAHHDHSKHYIKIWGILLGLLVISIAGTFTGVFFITMVCAFGVATVKAFLVIKHFMHLDTEKKIVWYALAAGLAIMVLFFAAVSPDILNHAGSRWVNVAAEQEKARREEAHKAGADDVEHHGEGHEGGAHEGAAHPAEGGHEAAPPAEGAGHAEAPAPAEGAPTTGGEAAASTGGEAAASTGGEAAPAEAHP